VRPRAAKEISTIFDHCDAAFSDDYLGGLLVLQPTHGITAPRAVHDQSTAVFCAARPGTLTTLAQRSIGDRSYKFPFAILSDGLMERRNGINSVLRNLFCIVRRIRNSVALPYGRF
jgi:hypothetical protein